jgi:hypothetical protein
MAQGQLLREAGLAFCMPRKATLSERATFAVPKVPEKLDKDYYAVLGVPGDATPEELRAAYRRLAKKFHPDAAAERSFPDERFAAISEAYEVLSTPRRRAAYDEGRRLHGYTPGARRKPRATAHSLLQQAEELRQHMRRVDKLRMNHEALRDFVNELLQDKNLECLETEPGVRQQVFERVFESVQSLTHRLVPEISGAMLRLAGGDAALLKRWNDWAKACEEERRWNRYRPVIVFVFAALLCLLLWWLARP